MWLRSTSASKIFLVPKGGESLNSISTPKIFNNAHCTSSCKRCWSLEPEQSLILFCWSLYPELEHLFRSSPSLKIQNCGPWFKHYLKEEIFPEYNWYFREKWIRPQMHTPTIISTRVTHLPIFLPILLRTVKHWTLPIKVQSRKREKLYVQRNGTEKDLFDGENPSSLI